MADHLMENYARLPIAPVRGRGCRLEDARGQSWLDFTAGIAVNTLGHAHPALTRAIAEQAGRLLHCSNLYRIPQQEELAARLAAASTLERAFFCNSGAEANEAAIKLARRFFHQQGQSRRTIITALGSFHGRTLATIAATGQEKVKQGFDPLPPGFVHVPFNDLAALEQAVDDTTAAVMLEPIQGEGGVRPAAPDYLAGVRALCDRHGILLILDEVQTGIGRTGTMFAFAQAKIRPDILTLAKGLGGGVPIGAMLAGEEVARAFTPGSHGSTFGGNPLACAAACCVLDQIDRLGLLAHCRTMGARLRQGLERIAATAPAGMPMEVRGRGLLLGLDCGRPVAPIIDAARARGLLLVAAGPEVIRLIPPLIITEEEIDQALAILAAALDDASRTKE
ncbi:MAG: acetylornithine transaminase [Zetaproteobacteria bacterium]|nr:MAG: acetylornithine transaminase [Zetaproteobacteria bacterium]